MADQWTRLANEAYGCMRTLLCSWDFSKRT